MTDRVELEALDLAALLCSRVCHDIISPVGAIINGLEVLDEEKDEEMKAFAFDLIRKSAAQASAKLQFARLAFGAAGSAGAEIDLGDADKVATGYMKGEKAEFSFTAPRALMAKNRVKLLLNLILLANAAVPRGGRIAVTVEGDVAAPRFLIRCTGPSARVPAGLREARPGRHRAGRRSTPTPCRDTMPARWPVPWAWTCRQGSTGEDVVIEACPPHRCRRGGLTTTRRLDPGAIDVRGSDAGREFATERARIGLRTPINKPESLV